MNPYPVMTRLFDAKVVSFIDLPGGDSFAVQGLMMNTVAVLRPDEVLALADELKALVAEARKEAT